MSENKFWICVWGIIGSVVAIGIAALTVGQYAYFAFGYHSCVVGTAILTYCK